VSQLMQWFSMGGYSFYVWPAYGLVFMVLMLNVFVIKKDQKLMKKKLIKWFNQEN